MRSLRTALFVLVAVLCSGCQLRLALDVEVDRNGGGTLALTVAADAALLRQAQEAGADPLTTLVGDAEALEGWRIEDIAADDGGRTVTLSTAFEDPAGLDALASQLTTALSAEEVMLLERLEVSVTDDQVQVAGTAGADLRAAVREYGLSPRRAERLLREREALIYSVTVVPPGQVVTTSEGAISAGDAPPTWTIAPGETVDFELTSTRPRLPIVPAIIGAAVGLVVAWLVLRTIVTRRNAGRRRSLGG